MRSRPLGIALVTATLVGLTSAAVTTSPVAPSRVAKWPPWISIESPVNPYDPSARGALFLIRAAVREGTPTLANVSATAEGLVGGVRRTVAIRIDTTAKPAVFAIRRQWPTEGTWLVRVSLLTTTAIVSLDRTGNVSSVRIPTELASGIQIPRAVAAREIDSALANSPRR
jgi:hypothetical protein